MESRLIFKFKDSGIFSPDEVSELYKLFKIIDEANEGIIRSSSIEKFVENMLIKDNIEYTMDDFKSISSRVGEY